ncbi:MAG: hypothetical protein Q4G35_04805 [Propionibacteriaceae bacterium]|nr:hypothetical protein [Propionibacteriaceae bacterium]
MTHSLTPSLDHIARHGNRGHHGHIGNNNMVCADGTELSIIARGSTHSSPRPALCYTNEDGEHVTGPSTPLHDAPCDYAGPYEKVEVYTADPELIALGGGLSDGDRQAFPINVDALRNFIIRRGGKFDPVAGAVELLRLARQPHDDNPTPIQNPIAKEA